MSKIENCVIARKLANSASKVITFFESKMQNDGSYGADARDIACYFKSPMMYIAAKKQKNALIAMQYIKNHFLKANGDFLSQDNLKSSNSAYNEYWAYTNGWIVRAANLLDMKEIVKIGYQYLAQFNLGSSGFLTNKDSKMTDVLSTAHFGLLNLEMDKLDIAIGAGDYLCEVIEKQPNLSRGFYLRQSKEKDIILNYPKNMQPFYYVSASELQQLHFMIGYPASYLALLYKKTNNLKFLEAAKSYIDFSLSCDESIYSSYFSHKIAWAASLLYEVTKNTKYLVVIDRITDYFIRNQKDGMWFVDDINVSYDQGAEIACWFLEIINNIN